MATYYINADSGSDSTGTGTSSLPWKTLSKAVSMSTTNDTIICQYAVADYGAIPSISSRTISALVFGDAKFTYASYANNVGVPAYNCIWNNIIFDITVNVSFYMFNSANASTFNNCWFKKSVKLSGADMYESVITFNRCLIQIGTASQYLFHPGGYGSTKMGIGLYGCVLYGSAAATSVQLFRLEGGISKIVLTAKNNIIVLRGSGSWYGGWGGTWTETLSHNCIVGPTGVPSHTGLITSDPLFVDEANLDFRLRPSSPCLGTGILL